MNGDESKAQACQNLWNRISKKGIFMSDKKKISKQTVVFWAVTGPLVVNLFVSGVGALTQQEFLVEAMQSIEFPLYVMRILGIAYVLALIAIIAPGRPLLKEWAYAGVVFAMSGAIASHISIGDTLGNTAPSVILMFLAITSYKLRPPNRRLVFQSTEG